MIHHSSVEPLSPLLLSAATAADHFVPGSLRAALTSAGEARHARFAALGGCVLDGMSALRALRTNSEIDSDIRAKLTRAGEIASLPSATTIIEELFGPVPDRFFAVLRRADSRGYLQATYARLYAACSAGDARVGILLQISGILTEETVVSALDLDNAALHPSLLESIKNRKDAWTINTALTIVREACSTITDHEIRQSWQDSGKPVEVRRWMTSILARRMDRLPFEHPIKPDDPDFDPLVSGRTIAEGARLFQNCIKERLPLVAMGMAAYAVARERQIILEMRPLTCAPHWLVTDLETKKGGSLDPEDWGWLLPRLSDRGLPIAVGSMDDSKRMFRDEITIFDPGFFYYDIRLPDAVVVNKTARNRP